MILILIIHDLGRPTIQQRTDQRSSNRFILKMSATLEATRPAGQKKTFGKSTREVPHHTQKAKKWYPAEDELQAKKVRSIMLLRSWRIRVITASHLQPVLDCASAIAFPSLLQSHQQVQNQHNITNITLRFANPSALQLPARLSLLVPFSSFSLVVSVESVSFS